jgi:hypothetical protein
MSMINDALKRAKETQPKSTAAAAGPLLEHVNVVRPARRPDLLLPLLVAVILLLAAVLFGLWWHSDLGVVMVRAKSLPEPVQPIHVAEISKPAPVIAPPVVMASPTNLIANVTNGTNATNALSPNVVLAAVEPPKPPPITYKLQSIFYRPNNPSAVINGKTLYLGSKVGEAHVLAIGKESATIVTASGQTILLELP